MNQMYIGADLGTSGLKLILMEPAGRVVCQHTESYPIAFPRPGWAEQQPDDWFDAFVRGIGVLLRDIDRTRIAGIGISGQMHGLVILDRDDRVIRPAILWNDGRSEAAVRYLNETVGTGQLLDWTGNMAFAGFTAPKLLWMREYEPAQFERIRKVMLPKDYLVYRLTGRFVSDLSDASGTLLLDVRHRVWSADMLRVCGLRPDQMPALFESSERVGTLLPAWADVLSLSNGVFVVAGASDNAAAAVGAGTVGDGQCNLSLGTSGTVLVSSTQYRSVQNPAIHHFAHANGCYHYLGCMLSAASTYDWWIHDILSAAFEDGQAEMAAMLGQNDVYFLPYLMGERSPHNDPHAQAAFIGMRRDTPRAALSLAVLEGVAFGLRDSLEQIRALGLTIPHATLVGGGSRNALWCRILANVLALRIDLLETEEGPALGSAILAACADGVYPSLEAACRQIVRIRTGIEPDAGLIGPYDRRYQRFASLYPALKPFFNVPSV